MKGSKRNDQRLLLFQHPKWDGILLQTSSSNLNILCFEFLRIRTVDAVGVNLKRSLGSENHFHLKALLIVEFNMSMWNSEGSTVEITVGKTVFF